MQRKYFQESLGCLAEIFVNGSVTEVREHLVDLKIKLSKTTDPEDMIEIVEEIKDCQKRITEIERIGRSLQTKLNDEWYNYSILSELAQICALTGKEEAEKEDPYM